MEYTWSTGQSARVRNKMRRHAVIWNSLYAVRRINLQFSNSMSVGEFRIFLLENHIDGNLTANDRVCARVRVRACVHTFYTIYVFNITWISALS